MRAWNVCLEHHPRHAGMHRAVGDFARALQGPILSFDPTVPIGNVHSAGDVHVVGVKSWSDDGPYLLSRKSVLQARNLLRDADIVILHSLFRAHCSFVAAWAHDTNKQFWIVPHGCLDPWGLAQRALAKRLWLRTVGRHVFHACSGVFFSTARESIKAAPHLVDIPKHIVTWPVDLPDEGKRPSLRKRFRQRHNIATDRRVLLYVGRLHTMKRVHELLSSFHAAQVPNCDLVVVGMDGNITGLTLREHASSLGSSRIHIIGSLHGEDLSAAMAAADGFASLSHRENFGYAAADALAAGLPLILSPGHDLGHELPFGPNRELSCGWLLKDDSLVTATKAVKDFSEMPKRTLDQIAANSRRSAVERFSRWLFEKQLREVTQASVAGKGPIQGPLRFARRPANFGQK